MSYVAGCVGGAAGLDQLGHWHGRVVTLQEALAMCVEDKAKEG